MELWEGRGEGGKEEEGWGHVHRVGFRQARRQSPTLSSISSTPRGEPLQTHIAEKTEALLPACPGDGTDVPIPLIKSSDEDSMVNYHKSSLLSV